VVVDVAMDQLDRVHERIAGRFTRSEPQARAREYVSGLVAGLERKNGWTLASANDKVATYCFLSAAGVAAVPHHLIRFPEAPLVATQQALAATRMSRPDCTSLGCAWRIWC
jgi:hypothetical protein